MSVASARDHFKNIISKIDGQLREEITDEILDAIISKNIKNIPDNEKKIIFGSLIILDDKLPNNSNPEDLIKAMNEILQHLVDFFKLLAPGVQPSSDNNIEADKPNTNDDDNEKKNDNDNENIV
jgi:hypothetical protein